MDIILLILLFLIQFLIGYNLIFPSLLLMYSGLKRKKNELVYIEKKEADYGIIVTAYEQIDLIPDVVDSLLNLNYNNYLIYIVADNCDISGLHFSSDKVILLRPPEALKSNTRSHFYAIERFIRPHERLTIIDSDNLVDSEYLNEINKLFNAGYDAVQGLRAAKNLNTMYACLDAARDIYYHFYDGKVIFKAGSSATLSGSGMAFTTRLYKDCLQTLDITGAGFDKVLQFEIVKRGNQIAFTEKAIVYDEKTTAPDQLVKQRSRWINTWFKYCNFGIRLVSMGIAGRSKNQLLFGLLLLRPPLFIFLLLSLLCLIISFFTFPIAAVIWILALVLFAFSFYLALRYSGTDARIYRSLKHIPMFIFYQIISLIKAGSSKDLTIATRHKVADNKK